MSGETYDIFTLLLLWTFFFIWIGIKFGEAQERRKWQLKGYKVKK